ncbi:MAG: ATP-grasp domain-containing protein [Candidatus Thorarchaeota archaeon]|jgi:predicted ATP-grasp superfamily ATP-dependent carboligase
MRIFLYEHISGGGFASEDLPPSFAAQGFAMLSTMARCLNHAGHDVSICYDARINELFLPRTIQKKRVSDEESWLSAVEFLSDNSELGLVIAPEDDGILVDVLQTIRSRGLNVVNPETEAVAFCSDKINTANLFSDLSLPVPKMIFGTINDIMNDSQDLKFPVVLKPAMSSGATLTFIAHDTGSLMELAHRPEMEDRVASFILQEYIDGIHSSVSLLAGNGKSSVLSVNRQNVTLGTTDSNPGYHGGESPYDHPASKVAAGYALKIADALPGLRGYIGIDFVFKGKETYPMEINPRLTVSSIGLERTIGPKGVASIIECATGAPPKPPKVNGYSIFEEYVGMKRRPESMNSIDDYARVMVIPGVSSPPFPLPNGKTMVRPYVCGWGPTREKARDDLSAIELGIDTRLEGSYA